MLSFIFILVKITSPEKEDQLRTASGDGNLDQVKDLVNTGTDVDAADSNQRTALWWAGKSMLKYFLRRKLLFT